MFFSLLLWLMGPSLVPSYSVSVIDFYFILYSTHIQVVDVIYDTMHYAYVIFLFFDGWVKI
jgi:hypothetical protein